MSVNPNAMNPNQRRAFLKRTGAAMIVPLSFTDLSAGISSIPDHSALSENQLASDEAFWDEIRSMYVQNPDFINLESGYFSPSPEPVKTKWIERLTEINASPSYYMRTKQVDERTALINQMAEFIGVSNEEIILTRNTTESLNIVIHGLKLSEGEEILRTNREYPSMIQALDQRSQRYGTKVNVVDIPLKPDSTEQIVSIVERAITPKTKVLLVSHIIYLNGQVLPVKEITAMAHRRGLEVIVDGAHAFTHIDQSIKEIDCDYYGCSLHKWFGAPLGNGLLYVKKGKAERLWPMFGDSDFAVDDIRKLSHFGTMPCSNQVAMLSSLQFNKKIGVPKKSARLKYLRRYWTEQVKDTEGVLFYTPLEDEFCGAIANVGIDGMTPKALAKALFDNYGIFTVAIDKADIQGVRVAPNFHNTIADLDRMAVAINELAS